MHAGGDGLVGMDSFGTAAQDGCIAGFQAQSGGIRRHVGARFVDDADDAERHAHLADLDAGRAIAQIADCADQVGQCGDLLQTFGHAAHRFFGEREPVYRGGIQAVGFGGCDIFGVFGDERRAALQNGIRNGQQRTIFRGSIGLRHQARRGTGLLPDGLHVVLDVFHDASSVASGAHFSIPLALECAP